MDGWWSESDNMTISVQLNLTGTGTRTELGNSPKREGGEIPKMSAFKKFPKFKLVYFILLEWWPHKNYGLFLLCLKFFCMAPLCLS